MKHITFYLDFVSPYAWLALEQMPKALQAVRAFAFQSPRMRRQWPTMDLPSRGAGHGQD